MIGAGWEKLRFKYFFSSGKREGEGRNKMSTACIVVYRELNSKPAVYQIHSGFMRF